MQFQNLSLVSRKVKVSFSSVLFFTGGTAQSCQIRMKMILKRVAKCLIDALLRQNLGSNCGKCQFAQLFMA